MVTTLHNRPHSDEELLDWLQLSRSENVGPITFHRLLNQYKTPRKALAALPELAARGGLKRPLKIISRSNVEKELTETRKQGAEIITTENPFYPSLLRHIESAPAVITVKGRLDLLTKPLFAIVGARNASAMGKKMAHQLAELLGQLGWGISSGLARGIDGAAHQGSLKNGTIAVLAGGLDQVYPQENQALYDRIGEEGVLLAESALGVQPQATLFPRRNRIISGISRCVLVVEAALKSGSLITARYALEQGRDVFAIPGHPMDPRARGCNQLIKTGAVLVETIEDIEQEITPSRPVNLREEKELFPTLEERVSTESARSLIKENLSYVPISVDELIRECQLQAADVWIVLLEMEIAGYLDRLPGGRVSLKEEWKNL
ncbi:MAG: DNA-protecting protein DprA [Alphaproteobacteria bacterium]|nr:DNA-protecting protein DprA [Alphaproteobacteria bacterium]